MKVTALLILLLIPAFEAWLLISGKHILFQEHLIQPGDTLLVPGLGKLGDMHEASLVCSYFTGYSRKTLVYRYASDNLIGRNGCPFVHQP